MKTPRELILERHQSAEAKLKAIRAEDLAACARSAGQASRQRPPAFDLSTAAVRFWQEAVWPWRRAWIGMAAIWLVILAFGLAARETPRIASTKPPRPDPEVLAVLQEQKQLLTQLLGPGAPPLVSHLRIPGPRSAAEPPPGRDEEAGRLETTLRAETQGCIKLCFPGRGQLVPSAAGLELQGQAIPAPSRKAFELELDAALTETFAQA